MSFRVVYLAAESVTVLRADELPEEDPSVHFIFRVAQDELALQLELITAGIGLRSQAVTSLPFRYAVGHAMEEVRRDHAYCSMAKSASGRTFRP